MQGLATGRISLDKGWDVVGMYDEPGQTNLGEQQSRFKEGLFNYRRYLSDSERGVNSIKNNNPFTPKNYGGGDGQISAPFPDNNGVPDRGRYPAFLGDVIGRAYRG